MRNPVGLRERLKSETSVSHERLEKDLRLLEPGLTSDRYARILAGFKDLNEGLARAVGSMGTASSAASLYKNGRCKLDLITRDLESRAPASVCSVDFTWVDTDPKLWGTLYVFEGSTLGGQVVSKHLRHFEQEGLGHSYFLSYGDQVGAKWRELVDCLEALPENDHAAVSSAAIQTFELISKHFREVAP